MKGPRRASRDVDAAVRAWRMKVGAWSVVAGALGTPIGVYAGLGPVLSFFLAAGGAFAAITGVMELSGRAASGIYMPSGARTPRQRGYSRAESLEVRDRYGEALEAYREHIEDDPADPEPYLRIGRIHRDRLDDPEEGIRWFRKARELEDLPRPVEILLTREIVETYIHRLDAPERALPELARLVHRHAGTDAGEAARRELRELREEVHGDAGPAPADG